MGPEELAYKVGKIEANTDTILEHTTKIAAKVDALELRVDSLETNRKVIRAIWAGIVAVITFGFKKG